MNDIAFRVQDRVGFAERVVQIEIDGRNLIEWLRELEAPFAHAEGMPDIAGSYEGLPLSAVAPPSPHFLGFPHPEYAADDGADRVAILVCRECGTSGCWPFELRITVSDDTVRWSDYRQPHRRAWRYETLPPLCFARTQYEAALAALADA